MKVLHGPLNAAVAAETAASTSREEAASTWPTMDPVLGDVMEIMSGGWVREDTNKPLM